MQTLIDSSTAHYAAGPGFTRRQFQLAAGPYSGRKVVIYNSGPATIKFSFADPPYTSWSQPVTITTAAADFPAIAWLDPDGGIYLAYTAQTTLDLIFRKLTFGAGEWSVGPEIVIYGDKDNYFPSLVKGSLGRLQVSWSCYDSGTGQQVVRHKRSTSDGAVWGSGPSDAGNALTAGSVAVYSQLVHMSGSVYCLYTDGGTRLACRRMIDGALQFKDETTLYQGVFLGERFAVAVAAPASMIGVAFEALYKLWYMEFDGANWSGLYEITSSPATGPLVLFNGATPCVVYGSDLGGGQIEAKYRIKSGAGFAPQQDLAPELRRFHHVFVYDDSAAQKYASLTVEAASSAAADVIHPTSGKLLEVANDAIYLGADAPFAEVMITLSTPGVGGTAEWQYFDGTIWRSFTPTSGAYNLDAASRCVRLWIDSAHCPVDWQKNLVELKLQYWLRIVATAPFTTPPVGSQITPLPQIAHFSN